MILCFFNIWLMDVFFNNFWTSYYAAVSTIGTDEYQYWNAFTSKVFPKLAKCDVNTYGVSGSLQRFDALCLLPLNVLNEKIFAFLYIWFISLTILSIFNCIFLATTIFCERLRFHLIYGRAGNLGSHIVSKVNKGLTYGDWFILYKISSNINHEVFENVISDLYKQRKGAGIA